MLNSAKGPGSAKGKPHLDIGKRPEDGGSPKGGEKSSGPKSHLSGKSSGMSDEDDDPGMAEYIKRKNELKQQQQAEEEEARKKVAEESRKKFEANELPRDPEKEKRHFLDEMFGKDFPISSRLLLEELKLNTKDADGLMVLSEAERARMTHSQ